MSSFLVDTNIWSEALRKEPDPNVIRWLRDEEPHLYCSVISVGELKHGIDRLPAGKRRQAYQDWLTGLTDCMKGRVLSFNVSVATVWGQLLARCESKGVQLPSIDSQIAATAVRHSLVVATRNERDFAHSGVKTFNPFNPL